MGNRLQGGQLLWSKPAPTLAFEELKASLGPVQGIEEDVKREPEVFRLNVVNIESSRRLDLEIQLFYGFSAHSFLRRLTFFDAATEEGPKTGVVQGIIGSVLQQNSSA